MMLYDPIRKKQVAATPEELVRQALIAQMIGPLGYPKGLLAVEKELSTFSRRVDLLCFVPGKEGLSPLLLVECKASDEMDGELQAFGYNQKLQAPFVALAGPSKVKTIWREREQFRSVPFLPTYQQLLCALKI